jgi:tetratricopeptide (TPR) repeat protein
MAAIAKAREVYGMCVVLSPGSEVDMNSRLALVFGVALTVTLAWTPTSSQELGTITFPTSGAAGAQAAFLEGVKDLHNFQFDEAAEAFKRAQQTDPKFVMAFWGEAMSYNHPLWAQQDTEAAKRTLEKIAPTLEGRIAKAGTAKEKAYIRAVDSLFYGPTDKLARDNAYSDAMSRMYAEWPTDHEVATLYALSLLGTVRPGDKGFRRQALAASIVEKVYRENPKHPGAAHFIIHSFDDPDHAPLALPAARAYAGIAPSAAHALHMPSHIFVQLGMWEDVAKSNIVAYKAAADLNARMKLGEGREDFHTLGWLTYANLMMGKFDEAKQNVETARQASERNKGNRGVRDGYLGMRARYILETGQWEKIALDAPPPAAADAGHANMPGMAMPQYGSSNTWTFIAGYSAAKMGDYATADASEAQLKSAREKLEATNPYGAKPIAIMEKQVGAVSRFARGQKDEALKLAKEAMDIELTLAAPSGPPDPIKPAPELYGELLLEAGKRAEAVAALELSLQRTPNRTPSVKAMQRAATTTSTQAQR